MIKRTGILACIGIILASCQDGGNQFAAPPASDTGIDFVNRLQESNELNILDYLYFYNGGGVAVGDINGDDLPDIYFSGNQVPNRLYLNEGDMKFRDITESAGVAGNSTWNTGVVMADVNADGLLDIYVCAVVGINGFSGHNELFINNGDNTFTERASEYGLDFDTFSSNAAFFDYDGDGDLDMYLLNHAVHTQDSYGKASLRYQRNYDTGDKLMRNDNGRFTEVSEAAGIYGGINGYGLGLAVSDFNQDGYPDLYVGNDFHEDDYFYLNNGDGTFTESLRAYFGHTSRFSMGSDVADINNDGRPDLISLDMLPEDEVPLKSSEGDDKWQTQQLRTEDFGYYYQFTRNMLYVNQPDGRFMETALMSGVAATDWSWSALFADYDLDGHQDLFISNGIPKRPNDLDFVRFISNEQISSKMDNTRLVDQKALDMMPSGNVHNYIFQGGSDLRFTDRSGDWIGRDTTLSGATATADLDNDGDLDLVISNINQEATVLVNRGRGDNHFLKLRLQYEASNPFGIGTKALAYSGGTVRYRELFPVRGFQASSEPVIHFGFPAGTRVDSLQIVWPDNTFQTLLQPGLDQTLTVRPEQVRPYRYDSSPDRQPQQTLFRRVAGNLGLDFTHREDRYTDFNREKLLPYSLADRGPAVAAGDLDGDGREDIYFGGSKREPARVYLQRDTAFVRSAMPPATRDSVQENIYAVIRDLNGDGANDLVVANGGSDYFGASQYLANTYYTKAGDSLKAQPLPEDFANSSVIRPFDFDQDGDLDLFVGNQSVTGSFGKRPDSHLLLNENGFFNPSPDFDGTGLGMVTDALWTDFNGDGQTDLIVVGEWMAPRFYANRQGRFTEEDASRVTGLWQAIAPFDMDQDGDTDYVLGNWGTNSKFSAPENFPMRLYLSDFDQSGSTDPVIATAREGRYYPLVGLDELASQMVSLRKKYPNYRDFAGRSVEEIFGPEALREAEVLEVSELRSGFLRNENGRFEFVPFAPMLQVAPILELLPHDFDGDGREEILAAGNYFGVKPYQGRLDSFPGALIGGENKILLANRTGLDLMHQSVRRLEVIRMGQKPYLLVVFNDAPAAVYELTNTKIAYP
ncbi:MULTISPECIES: VCBS repeat-containing protein [unclassified Robiginitalea]|uniref:VCBS repeat-containing protein n=1 Tax=Robiginitalea TaxID=252306 RepID=UPI00234B576B|nr:MULTISPECIES: VCBS repeat-containing protein [unclassified Robiginitalea]MDC6352855.1 VCBS repeat-containing protein [Robiginitalea sp. PM2]MDC6373979.1 VCBS repeat-containing protein [Robiginitalea sp. SP8]